MHSEAQSDVAHELNTSGWNINPWNDQQAFVPTQQTPTENADDFDPFFQPPSIPQDHDCGEDFAAFLPTDDATQTMSERVETGIEGEEPEEHDCGEDAPHVTQETCIAENDLNISKKNKTMGGKVISFIKRRISRLLSSPKKNYTEATKGKSKQVATSGVIDLD